MLEVNAHQSKTNLVTENIIYIQDFFFQYTEALNQKQNQDF